MKGAAVFEFTDTCAAQHSRNQKKKRYGAQPPSAATEESSQVDQISIDRSADETSFIRALADATEETEVGGKARNLARLIALGVPVPDGVVITCAAFERFLQLNRLRAQLEPLCLELDPGNPDQLRGISEGIRMLLTSTPFPPEIQRAIDAIARELLPESVLAVRSSAVGEDGARASFAGQFDSILGVTTKAALEDAVRA